eukprot:187588-Chlamydomonas_euryale.AAC.1
MPITFHNTRTSQISRRHIAVGPVLRLLVSRSMRQLVDFGNVAIPPAACHQGSLFDFGCGGTVLEIAR